MNRLRNAAIVLLTLAGLAGCDPGGGAVVAPAPDEEVAEGPDRVAKKGRKAPKAPTTRQPSTGLGAD
ncbi:hypothetical protein [Paludisphaera soli]|uniref:hypothetical protein n=1 Tax=Paludisphaera soli TaxID=2712865 RepID=UPI0013EC2756|nr:hypothetical protein [Paludisphaera soli]